MNKFESKYFNTAVKMDEAFLSLLKTKSFEYITVSEICKTAGVNRSTFYLHYETVGDLLEETEKYLIDKFLSYFSEDRKKAAFDLYSCDLSELNFITSKYLTPYLTFVKENKEAFATALLNCKTLGFKRTYSRLYENIFYPILERYQYPKEDREYIMMYYLSGITAVINEWIKEGCEKDISILSNIIRKCIFGLNRSYVDFVEVKKE